MANLHSEPLPSFVRKTAEGLGKLSQVVAIALGGSRGSSAHDARSDFDLYVYCSADIPPELRRSLAPSGAEIDNRFWEPGDEWIDPQTGGHIDVMYRSPAWIQDQLDRVLVRYQASTDTPPVSGTTCCIRRRSMIPLAGTQGCRHGRPFPTRRSYARRLRPGTCQS